MSPQWADVIHNVASMRKAPQSGSEQVSQAIMGDAVQLIDSRSGYTRVQTSDEYEGWILENQLQPREKADLFTTRDPNSLHRIKTPFADLTSENGELITRLVFGTLVLLKENENKNVHGDNLTARVVAANGIEAQIQPECLAACVLTPKGGYGTCETHTTLVSPHPTMLPAPVHAPILSTAEEAGVIARNFLGTPYLWGGTTPFGFDCSGFVQRIYSACGVLLPRDAYLQAASPLGEALPDSASLRPGDLVFFCGARDPRNRGITHVGLMTDSIRMIHAYGKSGVTLQPLRDPEILSAYAYRGALRLK